MMHSTGVSACSHVAGEEGLLVRSMLHHAYTSVRMCMCMPWGTCPSMPSHTRPIALDNTLAEARTTQILQDINEASMLGTFHQLGLLVCM